MEGLNEIEKKNPGECKALNPGRYARPGNGGARPGAGRPRGKLKTVKVNKDVLNQTLVELFGDSGDDEMDVATAKMRMLKKYAATPEGLKYIVEMTMGKAVDVVKMEADINVTEHSSSDDLLDSIIDDIEFDEIKDDDEGEDQE